MVSKCLAPAGGVSLQFPLAPLDGKCATGAQNVSGFPEPMERIINRPMTTATRTKTWEVKTKCNDCVRKLN